MTDATAPPPARRRQRRKDARPAEIIAAGLIEFGASGFAGTRMDAIAARAGIAKGTIYRYFPDKEALFVAAIRSRVVPVIDGVADLVDHFPGTARQLLELMFTTMHRQMADREIRVIIRVLVAEGEHFPALTGLYYRETIAKGRDLIGRVIARGKTSGEFRADAVADLPLIVIAPALMAVIWKLTFAPHAPIPDETFLKAHLDLIFEGLMRRD